MQCVWSWTASHSVQWARPLLHRLRYQGDGTYPGTKTRVPGWCSRSQDQWGPECLATESCVGAVVGELGASVGLGVETQLPGDPFPTTALAEVSEKEAAVWRCLLHAQRPEGLSGLCCRSPKVIQHNPLRHDMDWVRGHVGSKLFWSVPLDCLLW